VVVRSDDSCGWRTEGLLFQDFMNKTNTVLKSVSQVKSRRVLQVTEHSTSERQRFLLIGGAEIGEDHD
jgi:hypothetical protein